MHRMQLTLLLEHGNLDGRRPAVQSWVPTIAKLSAFRTETLFGGWPASLGDMVRFLAQAGLSCDARTWEQTLFFCPRPGTQVLVRPHPPCSSPSASLAGRGRGAEQHEWSSRPPPTPPPLAAHAPRQQAHPGTCQRNTLRVPRETLKPDMPFCPFCRASPDCPGPPPAPWFRLAILHNFVPPHTLCLRLCIRPRERRSSPQPVSPDSTLLGPARS